MKKPFLNRVALSVAVSMLIATSISAMSVKEIIQKANHQAYYAGQDGKAKVVMSIFDKQGRERNRQFTILRKDIDDAGDTSQKFYVYFERPSDVRKTSFLVWKFTNKDDDRWLYLPALDLVKRIAASDKRSSFVGSHFFYEDVSGRNPEEDTHTLVEETDDYYVLKSMPKDPASVNFAYYKSWIHKKSFIPVKTEYFDKNNTVYRTYTALKVDVIQGFPTVTQSKMEDTHLGGYTTLSYKDVSYNLGLAESLFTERYLRNAPRDLLR